MSDTKVLWDLLNKASRMVTDQTWRDEFNALIRAPINPLAGAKTRAVLDLFYSYRGNRIVTGQHEYIETPYQYTNHLRDRVALQPLIKGFEIGHFSGQSAATIHAQRSEVANAANNWIKNEKGIATITYHPAYPGSAPTWANVQRNTTQAEFDQIVTPGTTLHTALIAELDLVATYLIRMRDNGTPILWRPYHEMNGGWFWWGNKNNFAQLWEIMYDRFVNFHGLHNLLWVWSPNAENQWTTPMKNYYPGHWRVDILAQDIYNWDFKQEYYDSIQDLAQGKLTFIGECGEMPNIDILQSTQPLYTAFMTWGKMLWENNTEDKVRTVYNHQFTRKLVDPVVVIPDPIGDGLNGKYYSGRNFETLIFERIDPTINFDWTGGRVNSSMPTDNFSIRWTGYLMPKSTETYTIFTQSDDGARVYIDGVLVTNKWVNGSATAQGNINLVKGQKYEIVVEYYDSESNAKINVSWQTPTIAKEIIPQEKLFTV
jgi:mannan endo-1,4-beta-mannosidase